MILSSFLKRASVVAAIACLSAASACGDSGGPADTGALHTETPTAPTQVAIDTNATVTVSPGQGVGVFVEYAAGGQWTVTTACDTNLSQQGCGFDIYVSGLDRSTTLSNPQGKDLGDGDVIEAGRDGTLHLVTETSTKLDGFTFSAPPGAAIELAMFLDGSMWDDAGNPQSRFIYWIGDSVFHKGAPTDPIDFAPTTK